MRKEKRIKDPVVFFIADSFVSDGEAGQAFPISTNSPTERSWDLDLLTIGLVLDMWTEKSNDDISYDRMATQEDFDKF